MDAEAFADSLQPVCSIAAFDQWARETLPRFVPHAMSMFGFAVRHALGFAIERVVTVNLPPEYLRSISGPAGALMCPVLYDWFRSREPQIFEVDAPHGDGVDAKWLATFRAFHLQSLGVHGHTSPCGRMVTFVGFYRLPNAQTEGRQALRLVAPAVHEALLRSCAPAPALAHSADALDANAPPRMTEREREIVRWLAAGKTNWEVGQILGISDLTVKTHVQRLLNKTGTRSRTQMVAHIVRGESQWWQAAPGEASRR